MQELSEVATKNGLSPISLDDNDDGIEASGTKRRIEEELNTFLASVCCISSEILDIIFEGRKKAKFIRNC